MKNKKKILSLIACLSLLSSCNRGTSSNSSCPITNSTPTSSITPDVEPSIEELNQELFENYAIFTNYTNGKIRLDGFKSDMPERLLNLEAIIIPESINGNEISVIINSSDYTFGNFKKVKSIKIPSTVQYIITSNTSSISSPFTRLSYLENIEVDSNNHWYSSKGNCLISTTDNLIVCGWGNVEIPDGITSIRNYCFYNNYSITSIKLNKNINNIASSSFKGLTQLNNIDVNGNTNYTVEGNVFFSSNNNTVYAAYGHVDYPVRMGTLDVSSNPSVTSITLTNGVLNRFAQYALRETLIEEITIPASVTYLPEYSFTGTSKLKKITIDKNNTKYACSNNCVYNISTMEIIGGCGDVIIPEGITEIKETSFHGCTSITSIYFPSSISSIKNTGGQFGGLNGLNLKLSISEKNLNYKVENNCLMKVEGSDNIVINALPNNDTGDIILPTSATIFQSASFDNECLYAKSIKFND